jgi:eukaryotic-like serine/threonine-protein kinase
VIDSVVGQRYRIVRLLGAGGMGSVYEAIDAQGGGRVAVKVITAEMAKNDTLMGRFSREAKAATTIDTPHIVKVFDEGTDAATGLPYLVMELLDGEDVQQLIRRLGQLSPDLALRVTAQACMGLQKAHDGRIIHRDIKPANLFLARTGRGGERVVKLLDFGIAKISRDPADDKASTAGLTRTGSMLGSPLYMSPEQARGHKDIDRRADIWSLGVVLYQALTGRTPHQDSDALGELIIAICTEEAAPIQEHAPWVSPSVAAVAHRAMRFDPGERWKEAAEMLEAITALLPGGVAIDEAMFTPLGDADRGKVEPRLLTQPDQPVPRGGRSNPGTRTGGDPVPAQSLEGLGKTLGQSAGAVAATTTPALDARRGSRTALLVAGAAVAMLGGGFAAYQLMRPGPAPVPVVTAAAATPPPPAAPPADATPKPRTVTLVVLPADALVDVDGARVPQTDGIVEISGALGSVHKVKLSSGSDEAAGNVVVTENGAMPPKMQIDAAISPRGPRSPAPGGVGKAAPKGSGAPLDLRTQR